MNSTIEKWQKNCPSTLIRTDSDAKTTYFDQFMYIQSTSLGFILCSALQKSVGSKNWTKNRQKIESFKIENWTSFVFFIHTIFFQVPYNKDQ